MMMPIALCLQTCDRPSYTARTLETFARHNNLSQFALLHADDSSETDENNRLAKEYGFDTVFQANRRLGVTTCRMALIAAASACAKWVLLLENDIETLRPFPWALFAYTQQFKWVYCLRLYGRFKDVGRIDPCLVTHKRERHRPVEWRPFRDAPEKAQVGRIHWSAQPSVTRITELLNLHRTGREPGGFTARVKKNVMAHFGYERTPGRIV